MITKNIAEKSPLVFGVGAPIFFGFIFLLLYIYPSRLLIDGSTCRHFLTGLEFWNTFHLPTTSFSGAPGAYKLCLTHCLLGDLLWGLFYKYFQLNGVVVLGASIFALTAMWSYQLGRARGLGPISGLTVFVLMAPVLMSGFSARCHAYSYLFTLALYFVTFVAKLSEMRRLITTVLIMALWANFHPTYLMGLAILVVRCLGSVIDLSWLTSSNKTVLVKELKWSIGILILSMGACCLNLRGPGFYGYALSGLTNPLLIKYDEYAPIDFAFLGSAVSYLALFCIVVGLWAYSRKPVAVWEFILVCGLFCAGIKTMGVMPYFAVLVLSSMGPAWQNFCNQLKIDKKGNPPQAPWLRRLFDYLIEYELKLESVEKLKGQKLSTAWCIASIIFIIGFLVIPAFQIKDLDRTSLPVDGAHYLSTHPSSGLIFTMDNWSNYLYWKLARPTFIDDFEQCYPSSYLLEYLNIAGDKPGCQSLVDKYKVNTMVLPPCSALGEDLTKTPTVWKCAYQDQVCEIFQRAVKQ